MLIGINGRIGSGKSTVTEMLYALTLAKTDSFASTLKYFVCLLTGCTREQLEDQDFKASPLPEIWWHSTSDVIRDGMKNTYRYMLQEIGTDVMRNHYRQDVWVRSLLARYERNGRPLTLISDVRFPDEAAAIKQYNGIVIRINRYKDDPNIILHSSETALDDFQFDRVIDNNGTMEELYDKVKQFFNTYKLQDYV